MPERTQIFYRRLHLGGGNVTALFGVRDEIRPVSFGPTVFNDRGTRAMDSRNFIDATYTHDFNPSRSVGRIVTGTLVSHFCIADPGDSTPLRDLSELVVFNSTAAQPLDRSERRATPECIRLLPQPRSAARQRQNM